MHLCRCVWWHPCCHQNEIQTNNNAPNNAVYWNNTKHAHFRDNHLYQAYKTTLKQQLNVEKR